MKKLTILCVTLAIAAVTFGQKKWTDITGNYQYIDSVRFKRLKYFGTVGDSVLSMNSAGDIILVKNTGGSGTSQNLASASLTANGEYIHNWATHQLKIHNIGDMELFSDGDNVGTGHGFRIVSGYPEMFANQNGSPTNDGVVALSPNQLLIRKSIISANVYNWLAFNNDGTTQYHNGGGNQTGIEYDFDDSSAYTRLSLINRGYVDDRFTNYVPPVAPITGAPGAVTYFDPTTGVFTGNGNFTNDGIGNVNLNSIIANADVSASTFTGTWNGNAIDLPSQTTGVLPAFAGGTGVSNGFRNLTINTNGGTLDFLGISKTLTIAGNASVNGTNTGDQTTIAALTTPRTISGTGEATFTTTAFDGSANVSGAVTLTNSAVIAKVLTGYTSGAGTVAATDNILQAFQKLNGNNGLNLKIANNLSDLANATTARTNLGLGTLATQNGTFSGTSSGTNTGDQTITLTGDATGSGTGSFAVNVGKLNGTTLSALATGLLKNTTGTGVPSIAVAGTDYVGIGGALGTPSSGNLANCTFPTLNQNTTGSAASLTTGRTISGTGDATFTTSAFDGTGNVSGAVTVVKINGTTMSGLATGILKNTTGTGVPSIAVAGDFPTLNQNTTGSAATLTTARTINGTSFDGSANITVTAAAGTLTGATLNSGVTASSLTSFGASPSLTTPILGTPTSGTLTNCTGLPIAGTTGYGAGVATALAVATNASGGMLTGNSSVSVNVLTILSDLRPTKTVTAAGTTGAQTINKTTGTVNFAAGASTLVVTNSLAATTSVVIVTVYGTDITATTARVTKAAGSFTITLNAAATAETAVGFMVTN